MTVVLPIVVGAILAGWSMLSLFGSEHERRAKEIASAPKPKESDNPAPAEQPAKSPAVSKVVR